MNSELTTLYWKIGKYIKTDLLNDKRAEYGKQIVQTLSAQLTNVFGRGWSTKQLQHCLRSAEVFSDEQIVSALRRQFSWTHLKTIMYIDDPLKREFYIELCKNEKWSSRQLEERIGSLLYERTAISKKPDETIRQDLKSLKEEQVLSPDLIFRDPYFWISLD